MLDKEESTPGESSEEPIAGPATGSENGSKSKSWQVLRELCTALFWRRNLAYIVAFAPSCFLPAFLVTAASVVLVLGNLGFYTQLSRGALSFHDLISDALICIVYTIAGLIMLVYGFGKWIFMLTTFCTYWHNLESDRSGDSLDRSALARRVKEAAEKVKARGKFLGKFWLHLFVVMLLPVLLLYLLAFLKVASSPRLTGGALFSLPMAIDITLLPICLFISVVLLIVSFVSVPVAAIADQDAGRAVKLVISLARTQFPQLLLISIFVVAINIIVGSPLALARWGSFGTSFFSDEAVQLCVAQEIWQGLLSVVLLPSSLVPFCALLKNLVHEPT
jgi:hypothetical protein